MFARHPYKTRSRQSKRVVKVVIDTSNDVGKPSRLELHDVPVPVTFDYLVAQMRRNGFHEPKAFSTRKKAKLEVVSGPSAFDAETLAGRINAEEPLCRYYHEHLRGVINMSSPKAQRDTQQCSVSGLSHAKIHNGDSVEVGGVSMAFMRTLRVPDDGKTHSLPAGLGKFPVLNAADFSSRLPPSIAAKGGVLMGMHQCEAMWISFLLRGASTDAPYAVKISAGGVNAITGASRGARTEGRQDYLAVTPGYVSQTWLDGFSTERGVVRQFVAVPSGEGLTVEAQMTRKEDIGGIQIDVFPTFDAPSSFYDPADTRLNRNFSALSQGLFVGEVITCYDEKSPHPLTARQPELASIGSVVHLTAIGETFKVKTGPMTLYLDSIRGILTVHADAMDTIKLIKSRVEVKAGFSSGVLRFQFDGERLQDDMRLCDYNIPDGATIYLSICMLGGAGDAFQAREAGFAAGGKIAQKIVRDRLPATAYNFDAGCRLHISVLSPGALARLTGEPPIPTPISIETYLEAGLPWFDLYDEGIPSANNVSAAHPLAAVKSLQHMLAERADADPTKHRCCYCAATASFELRPCGHRLCWDCADGLPVDECPRRCRNVTERKTLLTDALAESEAGWDCPAAGTADERIIVLERCAAQGLVGTFLRAADRVSGLSSDA